MERFRDFGGKVGEVGFFFREGAVGLCTPSYYQGLELDSLKKELESYLRPTTIEYATVSTIVNERFAITFGQTIVGELSVMDGGVISFWRNPKFANRGITSKATKILVENYKQYKQLRAFVLPNNLASAKALRNNGFICLGVSSERFYVDGEWQEHEEFVYTIES